MKTQLSTVELQFIPDRLKFVFSQLAAFPRSLDSQDEGTQAHPGCLGRFRLEQRRLDCPPSNMTGHLGKL
jgi:hypothetical protein